MNLEPPHHAPVSRSGALVIPAEHKRASATATAAKGRPVLTAAAVGQTALGRRDRRVREKHRLFTWAVLDALRKGDSNGNGQIELSELVAHVQSAIPKVVSGKGGSGQVVISETDWDKQSARFGSRGEDFVVARRCNSG